jgi:hypothetical protein
MSCVNIDWKPITHYLDERLLNIKMKLNITFDSILIELNDLSCESQEYIEKRLQEHIISIAEQQRKIARMHRQLSAATELLEFTQIPRQNTDYKKIEKIVYMILFGLFIGMFYERFIRHRIQLRTI